MNDMQKWEYLKEEREYRLAELGEEGWELVAVTHKSSGEPVYFYLKRLIEEK